MRGLTILLAAGILGLGVAVGGFFVGDGFLSARLGDRYVTAKGLSEQDVKADLAIWPIRFVVTGNNLEDVRRDLEANADTVRAFLTSHGFGEDEITIDAPSVTDLQAQAYRSGPITNRFIVEQLVKLRSTKVDAVGTANRDAAVLLQRGVILTSDRGPSEPVYVFTGLNDLKTEMVAEATKHARATAAQFASDSGAKLAGIRRADQGIFQIRARDDAPGISESGQIDKTVRVVSTLQYYLADE